MQISLDLFVSSSKNLTETKPKSEIIIVTLGQLALKE